MTERMEDERGCGRMEGVPADLILCSRTAVEFAAEEVRIIIKPLCRIECE